MPGLPHKIILPKNNLLERRGYGHITAPSKRYSLKRFFVYPHLLRFKDGIILDRC